MPPTELNKVFAKILLSCRWILLPSPNGNGPGKPGCGLRMLSKTCETASRKAIKLSEHVVARAAVLNRTNSILRARATPETGTCPLLVRRHPGDLQKIV